MGAYAAKSTAALELRVAEAGVHSRRALSSATAFVAATAPLQAYIAENFASLAAEARQIDPSTTYEESFRDPDAVQRLLATGVADAFLSERPPIEALSVDAVTPYALDDVAVSIYNLMLSIVEGLPTSVEEFIAAGEGSDTSTSTSA